MENMEPLVTNLRNLFSSPETLQVKRFDADYDHPMAINPFGLYLFGRKLEPTLVSNFLSPRPLLLGISEPYYYDSKVHADVCYFPLRRDIKPIVAAEARAFRIERLVERSPSQFMAGIGYSPEISGI